MENKSSRRSALGARLSFVMTVPVLPRAVSRTGRLLDLAAMLLVVGGGAMYAYAYVGLERLRTAPEIAFTRGMVINQLATYHSLASVSRWGLALIALGVGCAVVAWRRERRVQRA